jgi:radical SAM protein with 4Fe4S-binding SPASM domain
MFIENIWKTLAKWGPKSQSIRDRIAKIDPDACQLEPDGQIKYVWLNLDSPISQDKDGSDSALKVDDWLNIVDESAALGANSMVVSSGTSISDHPGIWDICHWAQSIHGMHVGIHIQKSDLSEDELSKLSKLDRKLTCLVVDKSQLEMIEPLNAYGIPIITSKVDRAKTFEHCTESGRLACIEADGTLQKCGLAGCNQKFSLGNALSQPILELVKDEEDELVNNYTNPLITSDCGACPSMVAQQLNTHKSDI